MSDLVAYLFEPSFLTIIKSHLIMFQIARLVRFR